MKSRLLPTTLLTLALGQTLPAQSPEADAFTPVEGSSTPPETLDEVVVEASKQDETLAESTASIGRIGEERLKDTQVRTLNDTYRLLANVRAPQFVDGGFVIRGVNSEAPDAENISGNQSPLATIFTDGIPLTQQGSRRGPTGMWDVRSVEVFRGPQSTLQGRNALAGSVHIHTRDPEPELGGAVRHTFGSFDHQEWAGMINLPLHEDLALRFTVERSETDSFVRYPNLKNFPRYDDFRTSESLQFRGKALYQPSHLPLRSLLTYTWSENSPVLADVYGPNADPRIRSFYDRLWLSGSGNQQIRETANHGASWENRFEIDDSWRLTSLSTYTRTRLDVGEIDGDTVRSDLEQDFSQELRLNGDTSWGKSVIGLYGALAQGESTQSDIRKERANLALFGETDTLLSSRLHLIAGGRLDYDRFDFQANIPFSGRRQADSTHTEFLPKTGLRYEFDDSHSLGLTLQRGYQSGGAGVDLDGSPYIFDPSSTWHYELSYRNAWFDKRLNLSANAFYSDWKDQQVVLRTVDSATFNTSERVINAAESSLYGAEIELSAHPLESLRLFGSVGLLSTRYDDFTYALDPAIAAAIGIPDTLDFHGYEFPEAPDLNFSLGFDYHHSTGVYLSMDAEYSGSYYSPVLFAPIGSGIGVSTQVPQDAAVKVDDRVTLNLTLGYKREHWEISFFARNLLDEDYVIGKVPTPVATPSGIGYQDNFLATVGAPRFIGCSWELKF